MLCRATVEDPIKEVPDAGLVRRLQTTVISVRLLAKYAVCARRASSGMHDPTGSPSLGGIIRKRKFSSFSDLFFSKLPS